jgi:hypothetical protein
MSKLTTNRLHEHAWSYFVLHADQRLRTFDFYLVLSTLIAGAMLSFMKSGIPRIQTAILATTLPFISFVFWKLDIRNKQLVKLAEEAIKHVERESGLADDGEAPHRLKLFLYEEYATAKLKRFPKMWPWKAHFSYSTCFNLVFFVFGSIGLICGLFVLLG